MPDLFRQDAPAIPRLLSAEEVSAAVGYSRVHIYRLMKVGEFPQRVQIGRNRVGWLESEVRDWLEERIEARRHADC